MKHLIYTLIIGLIVGAIFSSQSFILLILSNVLIFAMAAQGLNITTGYAGQISIAHGAFMAIGAYTTGYMSVNFGTPFILNLFVAIVLASISGIIIGFPALRLKGFFLAIGTLAFGVAVEQLISSVGFLGGRVGLRNIPRLFDSELNVFYLNLFFYAILSFFTYKLVNSTNGLKYKNIRDSLIAARSFGVNLAKYKLESFVISAIYGGIAGSLYAHTFGYLAPQEFGVYLSINFLAMIVVGGMASIHGGLIGAAIITGLPFVFSRADISMSLIFGILLIIFVLFFPRGIIYGLLLIWMRYLERPLIFAKRIIHKNKKYNGNYVNIKNKNIFYIESGSGDPVIMIHGNFASHRWFQKVTNLENKKIYALDLPNFGRSDRIEKVEIDQYADFVIEFIKKLSISKPTLIGHSLGGAVTMAIINKEPDLIKNLILVDSAPVDGLKTPEENYTGLKLLNKNRTLLKNSLKNIMPGVKDRKLINELTDEALLMKSECFTENARALEKYDYSSIKEKYSGNILFLLGKKDLLISEELAQKTVDILGAKLKTIEEIGHSVIVEKPELFMEMIKEFI